MDKQRKALIENAESGAPLSLCHLFTFLLLGITISSSPATLAAQRKEMKTELITDRGGSSQAAGPSAIKWGFMCSIAARRGSNLCAINFTRPPGTPWGAITPNQAPIAFWKRDGSGIWSSVLLDPPERTYQTPTLLLGPDGRANVFSLHAGSGRLFWFQARDPSNTAFTCREIPMGWGAYLGGGIDAKGRALLVYWGNGSTYKTSTIGYTVVDTRSGKTKNGIIDSPGAPYCYSHVEWAKTGAHVLTIRSEVQNFLINGSRNHYTELRYYYSPDPTSNMSWRMTPIYSNPKATIQPVGLVVDHGGRVHLLYFFIEELPGGKSSPLRLVYAVSREPVNVKAAPEFVKHEIKLGWDGRLFLTRNGQVHILAYQAGKALEYCRVIDGAAGRFTPWVPVEMEVPQVRLFPIGTRSGSTLTNDLEGVFFGMASHQHSMFYFRLPLKNEQAAR
jgi:hypothetical protein